MINDEYVQRIVYGILGMSVNVPKHAAEENDLEREQRKQQKRMEGIAMAYQSPWKIAIQVIAQVSLLSYNDT